jgi:hypothetical protein
MPAIAWRIIHTASKLGRDSADPAGGKRKARGHASARLPSDADSMVTGAEENRGEDARNARVRHATVPRDDGQ